MASIELAPEVIDDFDRILDHLATHGSESGTARIAAIVESLDVLSHSPLIGRPTRGGLRELVIGQGSHGHVALYRFVSTLDTVFVLAFRGQSESGFRRD